MTSPTARRPSFGGDASAGWSPSKLERLAVAFFKAYNTDLNGHNGKTWSDLHPFQKNAYIAGVRATLIACNDPEVD